MKSKFMKKIILFFLSLFLSAELAFGNHINIYNDLDESVKLKLVYKSNPDNDFYKLSLIRPKIVNIKETLKVDIVLHELEEVIFGVLMSLYSINVSLKNSQSKLIFFCTGLESYPDPIKISKNFSKLEIIND